MNDNQNDPVAYNAVLFEQHMEAARRLEVLNQEQDAAKPVPEEKRPGKAGLL
jgi:hypothetical protein